MNFPYHYKINNKIEKHNFCLDKLLIKQFRTVQIYLTAECEYKHRVPVSDFILA